MSSASVDRVYQPTVAGYFYPNDPQVLREEIDRLTPAATERVTATGVIVPHGLYRYAGAVMGETFSRVQIPRRCIIIGSNHTGCGEPWSVLTHGAFQTPLGDVEIDGELAEALRRACPLVVYAATRPGERERVLTTLHEQLQAVVDSGVTAEELAQAKQYLIGAHRMDLQQLGSLAKRSALEELYGLGYNAWTQYESRIQAVTASMVHEAAKRYLTLSAYAEVIVGPASNAATAVQSQHPRPVAVREGDVR